MKTLALIRTALLEALEAAQPVETALSWGLGSARLASTPRIVVQPTGAGTPRQYIGMPLGWSGDIAIRVNAKDIDTAQEIFDEVALSVPASATLTDPDYAPGWSLTLRPLTPIPGLTGPIVATAGATYRATLLPRMP